MVEIDRVSFSCPWNEKAFMCEFSKMASDMNIFLVAQDENGETAGYAVGNIIIDYVHILNLTVRPDMRVQGLGLALLQEIEREAFKRKLSSLTLEVRENNIAAINLYKKSGYVVKGRREKSYDGKEDELLMWKVF
jgi:ribosomal-protein-alanine N-acetyltransferase